MKIERLKSILLIMLVISSILLTVNKWFNEKLWPQGYNFFSDIINFFSSDEKDTEFTFNANEEVLKPSEIIINNTNGHILYTKSTVGYDELFEQIKSVLSFSNKSTQIQKTDVIEWNNNLKNNSCYFSYPVSYGTDYLFSQISTKYKGDINSVKEFMICPDMRLPSVSYLYIKDAKTANVEKIKVDYKIDVINNYIKNSVSDDVNYYSFELKFDADSETNVSQPILIDGDVLISITSKQVPSIYELNVFSDINDNEKLYSDVLSTFGFNSSTIRKYVENDNSMVFVENFGSVRLSSDGMLEYKLVDQSKAISLEGESYNECLNSCIAFVNNVSDILFGDNKMNCVITSDIDDVKSKTFKLTFDYYINDNMVLMDKNDLDKHAIVVEVVSGKIVGYQQISKKYIALNQTITTSSSIDAIDEVQKYTDFAGETISDISIVYEYDGSSNSWIPSWKIQGLESPVFISALGGF